MASGCFLCVCRLSFRIRDMLGYTVTARNSSCGRVMFSQACVKNSIHRGCLLREGGNCLGGCLPKRVSAWGGLPGGVCLWRCLPKSMLGYTPPQHYGIRSTSGQYASYWNAFLFTIYLQGRYSDHVFVPTFLGKDGSSTHLNRFEIDTLNTA